MKLIDVIKGTSMKDTPSKILDMVFSGDKEMVDLGIHLMYEQKYSISYAEYIVIREYLLENASINVTREILAVLFYCTKEYKEGKYEAT